MKSEQLFLEAKNHIVGGVNSPVRAFTGVGGNPLFFEKANLAKLFDCDGKSYIDYVCSWGANITGHADPRIVEAVQQAAKDCLSFGAPTEVEISLAKEIKKHMPSIDLIRMTNSGTEATMTAIRLARGFTNRNKIIKFEGCYHGHSDSLLVKAGSGALTLGVPSSAGVPPSFVENTLTAHFNDLDSVAALFKQYSGDIAAIIVEPIAGNMNCILPEKNFLSGLKTLCKENNSVLIFDEVMTGFRVALGGAQTLFNVQPDLTTLGKVIGGGMPVAALGGRKDIMEYLAPIGPVYQAGTLSGNPVAMHAGLAALKAVSQENFYQSLEQKTQALTRGLQQHADAAHVPFTTVSVGGMFGLFFTKNKIISNFKQATHCNINQFKHFFHGMLERGFYFAPSAYEAGFLSAAHQEKDINDTLDAAKEVFKEIVK